MNMLNDKTENLVSIITPAYNSAGYIDETIRSVLNQTYPDWEMIIVDDCSTDSTAVIIKHYADADKRIRYASLPQRSGAAVARNKALRMARGKWIAFIDSDDLWEPDKLSEQISFMTDHNISFSYTCYEEMNELGQSLGRVVSGPRRISTKAMYSYCWPGCLTVIYNREKIGCIQIVDIKKNNDYAMWLQVIRKADCHLLNKNLAHYRRRTGSISNKGYLTLVKWHYKLFREADNASVVRASLLTLNNLLWGVFKKLYYVRK